jgi:hypothetical protein
MNKIEKTNQVPMNLISTALEKGLDVANLTALFDLQQRWEVKEAAKSFKFAMANFQGNKPDLIKTKKVSFQTKTGGSLNYNYNPLPKIQKAVDPVLSQFGLTYRWEVAFEGNEILVTCIVSHSDGHEERTSMKGPRDDSGQKSAIQQIGSSTSFLKRYTLEAALGLSSDEDDDGKAPTQKEVFSPNHENWETAMEAIATGTMTIEAIKKKYSLSSSNEQLLIDAIDVDELQLLFDLVEDKINPTDKPLIERIIQQKERVNYSKVLYTLNKLRTKN